MLKKAMAAAAVFLATLIVAAGCPRSENNADRTSRTSSEASSSSSSTSTGASTSATSSESSSRDGVSAKSVANPATTSTHTADPTTSEVRVPKPDSPAPSPPSTSSGQAETPLKDWPKPEAVIVATGLQWGYIEPCGCSGKENQRGGLSRRHSFLKQLAAQGWTVVPLDVGDQVRRYGTQTEIKFQRTAEALKTMHYRAVGFGPDDLRLPAPGLAAAVADVPDNPSPFVSANAALFGFDPPITPRFRIIQAGKLKLGVTAVIGDSARKAINNDDVKFKPADEALAEVLPELQKAHCDHLILLANATMAETKALAAKFPQFDFVITSGGAAEPPREPAVINGNKTRLIEVGQKGEYANVIGFFDDRQQPDRTRVVPLSAKLGESDEMHEMMAAYQDQLKQLELSGLGITPARHSSGRQFVGSKVCGDCHTKAYAIWLNTPHAKALDTLAGLKPSRQYDPECLSCHVTGWEPQKFYPYQGGYLSLEKTPALAHNGCENCHGPGSAHVAAQSGDKIDEKEVSEKQRAELAAAMRVPKTAETCIQCHDDDNSINFKFEAYWPKVEHKGKD
jgi:Cytochrome c554 and c-prime